MFAAITQFLTSKLAGPIFGAAALALTLVLIVQTGRLSDARADRDRYRDRIENEETGYVVRLNTCRGNVAGLDASLKAQNEAVAGLVEAGRLATEAAARAVEQARAASAAATRGAAALLARQPVGDECAAALNLLREPSP